MEVRLARVSDAAAIRAIYNAEVAGSTVTFDIEPRTLAQQRRWVEQHQGAHPAVVAVDAGEVAGFGSLSVFRDRAAYSGTVEDSVYVGEGWRGRGVGRLLLEELLSLARKQGFHSVIARIADDNAASIALHRRCGFELVGVEKEVGRKFNRWIDVAVLQLLL
ncbi:MAG TPA: GNAT family N-acetyltransferase [Acidimicrobiales bacterium]|nr:GNAT family N-acetyltransferase [Acidimicrobiales bacterium]